jgi:PQQ-dependent dehydrogenase (methanol/ethanol family)
MKPIFVFLLMAAAASAQDGKQSFATLCAGCHGADGTGGERGPTLVGRPDTRIRTEAEIREIIRKGNPVGGMPSFNLPAKRIQQIAAFVHSLRPAAKDTAPAGDVAAGESFFQGKGNCVTCHRVNGRGGWIGPDLSEVGAKSSLAEIEQALRSPGDRHTPGYGAATVRLRDGSAIRGLLKNESSFDVQLQSLDGQMHLLETGSVAGIDRETKSLMPPVAADATEFRNLVAYLSRLSEMKAPGGTEAGAGSGGVSFGEIVDPKPGNWPTYHGVLGGNRHSPLDRINSGNVAHMAARWSFTLGNSRKLEVTPVVMDGVMYVTTVNEAVALDARTGRQIWHYQRPRSKDLAGDAAGGINRGVALLGERVFLVTDNAHLLALDRRTGSLLWDIAMADSNQNYGATSAPLVVKDLVISGTSGGDEGVRGFIAAYKASTGERVWRFWTTPLPGEPGSETWVGKASEHGCTATWLTGTYDAALNLLYWTTGNPCPDYNGDERKGDNLYSDSVLALEPETGKLRWYYQFTPHDLHDWDAAQTPLLADATFQGSPRKLLMQANRNGFFYVLDRTNGKLLLAKPFVKLMTWASGIGPDGKPQVLESSVPTAEGVKVCPSVEGASNWMSTAFNPATKLFYVMALEKCNIFTKSDAVWKAGESYYGGDARTIPGEPGQKFLRALDIETGRVVWEFPQIGTANSWGGVLSTAGGVVFFGEDSGAFAAVDAATGKALWHFHTSELWKASPMTYLAGGEQFVAIAAGSNILAFGLP